MEFSLRESLFIEILFQKARTQSFFEKKYLS